MGKLKLLFIVLFVTLIISCDEDGPVIDPFLYHQLVASIEQDAEHVNMYVVKFKTPPLVDSLGNTNISIKAEGDVKYSRLSEDRLYYRFSTNALEERFQTIELLCNDTTYKFEILIQKDKPISIEKVFLENRLQIKVNYEKKLFYSFNEIEIMFNDLTTAISRSSHKLSDDHKSIFIKTLGEDGGNVNFTIMRNRETVFKYVEKIDLESFISPYVLYDYCEIEVANIKTTRKIKLQKVVEGIFYDSTYEEPHIINLKEKIFFRSCDGVNFQNNFYHGFNENESLIYNCFRLYVVSLSNPIYSRRIELKPIEGKYNVYTKVQYFYKDSLESKFINYEIGLKPFNIEKAQLDNSAPLNFEFTGNEILENLDFLIHTETLNYPNSDIIEIVKISKQEFELNANSKLTIRFYK